MSCHQMVCHLSDAFRRAVGDRPPAERRDNLVTRTVVKWIALRTSLPWPRGVRTPRDIDQVAGAGTPPTEFERDRSALIGLIERFVGLPTGAQRPRHFVFGVLTMRDWQRWAWAHVDHHLRQFGV